MKKIISGILGILMVTAVVGGTAYALFTSTATVSGISVSAGSAELEVYNWSTATYTSDWDTNLDLDNVFPGFTDDEDLRIKNSSSSNIDLDVVARLTDATNWGNLLIDAVEVRVTRTSPGGGTTGWKTLREWNDPAGIALPGSDIPQGGTADFDVEVRVRTTYRSGAKNGQPVGNELSGLSLNDIVFTLTGTQVL